ncbi:MAG TPA: VWA domain-containing protein [Gaiella sp.]|nr:VWA domain-containing protein [Gaiella sp.]
MSFEAPALLLGLLLVPLVAVGYWFLQRRPSRYAIRYPNVEVLATVAGGRHTWKRHVPAAILLLALTALTVAFARPTMMVDAPDERASVVLVVDISGSMRAQDVQPTRLAAAKQAMLSFLSHAPDTLRVGIVAFSNEPQVIVSPTLDRQELRQGIHFLEPAFGTALGDALARSVELARTTTATPRRQGQPQADEPEVKDEQGRALASILLLSDGFQTRGLLSPGQGAERARAAGIPVFTIALGTEGGTIVDREQVIPVPPDRETLASIAEYTGGESFDAETAGALEDVYQGLGSRVGRRQRPREVTSAFVAAGALLLVGAAGAAMIFAPRLP